MGRRCVFCGYQGKLTNEHVIPRWLSKAVMATASPQAEFMVEHEDGEKVLRVRTNGSEIDLLTRSVCGRCNNGWMRALEDACRPVLLPMCGRQPVTLTRAELGLIALWATKTAIMTALASPMQAHAVTPEMMTWLYERRQPPPGTSIWIGLYVGGHGLPPLAAKVMPRALHGIDVATGVLHVMYDWTTILGHLLLKVVTLPSQFWHTGTAVAFHQPKPLIPVHPEPRLESVRWPPGAGYIEPELIALSFAMCGRLMRTEPAA